MSDLSHCRRVVVSGLARGEASFPAGTAVARALFDAPVGSRVECGGERLVVADARFELDPSGREGPVCHKRLIRTA